MVPDPNMKKKTYVPNNGLAVNRGNTLPIKPLKERTLKLRDAFGGMPPLLHHPDKSIAFDWDDSEVVRWLLSRPESAEIVFNLARYSKAIVYCPRQGAWIGRRRAILPRKERGGN